MADRGLDELEQVGKAALSSFMDDIYQSINQNYENALTDAFSSMRLDTDMSVVNYDRKEYKQKYQRVGFSTQQEAERFASFVYARTGEKAVSLNYQVNGLYLVELPKQFNVEEEQAAVTNQRLAQEHAKQQIEEQRVKDVASQKQRLQEEQERQQEEQERQKEEERKQQDAENQRREAERRESENNAGQPSNEQLPAQNAEHEVQQRYEEPAYRQMSSQELINLYEKETQSFVVTALPSTYEFDREVSKDLGNKDAKSAAKGAYTNAIISGLQDEGEGLAPALQKGRQLTSNLLAVARAYGTEELGETLFKKDVVYRKPDGDTAQIATPTLSSGFKGVKATVLHGDLVIVNGQVATGPVRDRILAQHRARIASADSIVSGHQAMERAKKESFEEYKRVHRDNFRIEEAQRRAHFEIQQDKLEAQARIDNHKRVLKGKEEVPFKRAEFKPREYKEPVPNDFSATQTHLMDLQDADFRAKIYELRESGELLHDPNWVEKHFGDAVKDPKFNQKLNRVLTKEEKMYLNAEAVRGTIYGAAEYAVQSGDVKQLARSSFEDNALTRLADEYNKSIAVLNYSRTFQLNASNKELISTALNTLKKAEKGAVAVGAVTAVTVSDDLLRQVKLTRTEESTLRAVLQSGDATDVRLTVYQRMNLESALNKYQTLLSDPVSQKKEPVIQHQGRIKDEITLLETKARLLENKKKSLQEINDRIESIDSLMGRPEELTPEKYDELLHQKTELQDLLEKTASDYDEKIETVNKKLDDIISENKTDKEVTLLQSVQSTDSIEELQRYKEQLEQNHEELETQLAEFDNELPQEVSDTKELTENIGLIEAERGSAVEARQQIEALQRFYQGTTIIERVPLTSAETKAVSSIFDKQHFPLSREDTRTLSGMMAGTAILSNPERIRMAQLFHAYQKAEVAAINAKQDALEGRALDGEDPPTAEEWAELNNRRERYEADRQAMADMESKLQPTENTEHLREVRYGLEEVIGNGTFTVDSMLKFNEDFIRKAEGLNMQFVKSNGKFDIDMLENIKIGSDVAKELGLTEQTKAALKTINDSDYLNVFSDFSLGLVNASSLSQVAMKGVGKVDDELAQVASTTVSAVQKVKYTKAVLTRGFQVRKRFIDQSGLKKLGTKKAAKTAEEVTKKAVAPKPTRPVSRVINDKYLAKQARIHMIRQNLDKSALGTLSKSIQAAQAKFAESSAGAALKGVATAAEGVAATAIGVVAAALGIFIGLLLLIVAIICVVGSLAEGDFDPLAPMGYQDTAAYQLYDMLYQSEQKWLENDIGDFNANFNERKNLQYGYGFTPYGDYLNRFNGTLYEDDNKLYIAPFVIPGEYTIVNPAGDDLTNQITQYTGNMVKVTSNANYWNQAQLVSEESGEEETADYVAADNGHTSNIKDILAMIDVMYDASINDMDDEKLEMSLGNTVAKFQWEEFKQFFLFKWAREAAYGIAAWFNRVIKNDEGADKYIQLLDAERDGRPISYQAIQNYAMNLFEASHQQTFALETGFHKGETTCDNVQTVKLPITWFDYDISKTLNHSADPGNGHVAPYVVKQTTNESGETISEKIDLSLEDNPTNTRIYANNMTGDSWRNGNGNTDSCCLWNGMNGSYLTMISIEAHISSHTSEDGENNGCWSKTEDTEKLKHSYIPYYESGYGGQDTRHYLPNGENDAYQWSDRTIINNKGDSIAKKNNWLVNNVKNNLDTYFNEVKGEETYTLESPDKFVHVWYEKVSSDNFSTSDDSMSNWICSSYTRWWPDATDGEWWENGMTPVVCIKHVDTFTRNCKGHEFSYCGGHVHAQSIGLVYSITNEQIAMAGIDEEPPVALGFDLNAHGYDSIRGKVDLTTMEKDNVQNAATTGLPKTVAWDNQGSTLLHRAGQGLNLMIDDAGTWTDRLTVPLEDGTTHTYVGLYPKKVTNMNKWTRDIFEVDSLILKGNNVLATNNYQNYSAWDDGNMQMAVSKFSSEWHSIYGFDFPTEIAAGCYELSERDIRYIPYFQDEAQKADHADDIIRKTLAWVGNGHFEDNANESFDGEKMSTHDHYFLDRSCGKRNDDGTEWIPAYREGSEDSNMSFHISCATGDDLAFVNYISESFGDTVIKEREADGSEHVYDTNTPQAGNIVRAHYDDGAGNTHDEYYVYIGQLAGSHTDENGNEHTLSTANNNGPNDHLILNAMYRQKNPDGTYGDLVHENINVGDKLYVRMQMDGDTSYTNCEKKVGTVYLVKNPDFTGATLYRYVIDVHEEE